MENIFGRFEVRPITNEVRSNIDLLQDEYDVIIPPLLRVFVETFKIDSFNRRGICHYNEEVGFHNFDNSIERNLEVYKEQGNYYQDKKMLPIATSGIHSGGICVGLVGDEVDKVFIDNESYDSRFEKVAENIFEFVQGLRRDS